MPQGSLIFLQSASTEDQVVEAVHAYVAAWLPASLARLPINVRASEIKAPEDVARLAVDIARQRLDERTERGVLDVLEQLHPFFAEAAARLCRLQTLSAAKNDGREMVRRLFC